MRTENVYNYNIYLYTYNSNGVILLTIFVCVIGKRFVSPIKNGPREKRAKCRDEQKLLLSSSPGTVVGSSGSTPISSSIQQQSNLPPLHTALVGNSFLQVSHMKSMNCHLLLTQNRNLNTKTQMSPLVQLFSSD